MQSARFVPSISRLRWSAALIVACLLCGAGAARGSAIKWIDPSPAELTMKTYPKAPGAPAVILSYERTDDGDSGELTLHVRVKVLTEGGVSAGNIELPIGFLGYGHGDFSDRFSARTIREDGTVVPFVATASSMIVKENGINAVALPQVQVGSIVEFVLHYEGRQRSPFNFLVRYYAPNWTLQGRYFIRSAHFSLKLPDKLDEKSSRWVANLPPGGELKLAKNRVDLDLADVPAAPDEAFMPPASAALYQVRFFYYTDSRDKYWGTSGDQMDSWWSEFYKPTKVLVAAVHDLTLPTDDDEAKLRKLYAAVQAFDNTDLTRVHSRKEDEKEKLRELQNSEDVWNRKRGDSAELTLLFLALARAAGYQAYPMAIASRDHAQFDQNVLTWAQMNAMAAIVVVNHHEIFFDPGTKMCPFAHMAPWHANVVGVSTEAKTVKIRATPREQAKASRTERTAEITLAPDGSIRGTVKIVWTTNAALELRQMAITEDKHAVETAVEKELQDEAPKGTTVKLQSIVGLGDGETPLVATFLVEGTLGHATRKRMVVPAQFFASTAKPLLVGETRTQPIDFPSAYSVRDEMRLHLPVDFQIESLPEARNASMFRDSLYDASAQPAPDDGALVVTQRALILNRIDYQTQEYPTLHKYFEQVASDDQDQIILQTAKSTATTSMPNAVAP